MIISNNYQEHGYASFRDYNYKDREVHWVSNDTSVTPIDLFHYVSRKLTEVTNSIFIRFFEADENGDYSMTLDLSNNSHPLIKFNYHRPFARCYTLSFPEEFRKRGIYYLRIKGYKRPLAVKSLN